MLVLQEIEQKNIDHNMELAMEAAPESFGTVIMLYINCKVGSLILIVLIILVIAIILIIFIMLYINCKVRSLILIVLVSIIITIIVLYYFSIFSTEK